VVQHFSVSRVGADEFRAGDENVHVSSS
jgi:hypothetical protein